MNRKRPPTSMDDQVEDVEVLKKIKLNYASFCDLPVHIIEEILKYVFEDADKVNKFELASVCKLFYEIFCRFYRHKYAVMLRMEDLTPGKNGKLQSLLEHTQTFRVRTFSKVKFQFFNDDHKITALGNQRIAEFLKHYGDSLEELEFYEVSIAQIVRIISFTGRLKHLSLYGTIKEHLDLQQLESHLENLELSGTFTQQIDLRKLISLKSLGLNFRTSDSLSRVAVRENSLHDIYIYGDESLAELKTFFSTQNSIKHCKVSIKRESLSESAVNIFESCKFESLYINGALFQQDFFLPKAIETQTALQTLEIGVKIGRETVDVMGKFKGLRKLKIENWNSLMTSKELSVTDLDISSLQFEPTETYENFKKTFPKLKKLFVVIEHIFDIFVMIQDFEDLEYLYVGCYQHVGLHTFDTLTTVQNKLHTLNTGIPFETDFSFLDFLPNLAELHICWKHQAHQDVANRIQRVTEQPKLKIIELTFCNDYYGSFSINFKHHECIYIRNWETKIPKEKVTLQVENGSAVYEVIYERVTTENYHNEIYTYSVIIAKDVLQLHRYKMDDYRSKITLEGEIDRGSISFNLVEDLREDYERFGSSDDSDNSNDSDDSDDSS